MSKIALAPNASGTGTFSIASPNSNTDRTLSLPDADGTVQVSGNPISGTTGTFSGAVSGTTASFSGNVTLGTSVLATPTGSAPSYTCRAWVNFNGTGTVAIRASGNVTSITDNGVGDYTVNFTTAMSDANYVACATSVQRQTASGTNQSVGYYSGDDVTANTYSTTAVRISTKLGSTAGFLDTNTVSIAIFR